MKKKKIKLGSEWDEDLTQRPPLEVKLVKCSTCGGSGYLYEKIHCTKDQYGKVPCPSCNPNGKPDAV